jgi:hypothetical protein
MTEEQIQWLKENLRFNWLKNIVKTEPKVEIAKPKSVPLPEGKLYLIPCGCCKRPLFYYTHTIFDGLIPVYKNALNLKGESLPSVLPYGRINGAPCCKYPVPGRIQDCEIIDNPFINIKEESRYNYLGLDREGRGVLNRKSGVCSYRRLRRTFKCI